MMNNLLSSQENSGVTIIPGKPPFFTVGIAASAGGLEACTRFFEAMPSRPGMAFVVILHLSPEHGSDAAQLLQRVTDMPVAQVDQAMLLEPDHVYVIPPDRHLTVRDDHLVPNDLGPPPGVRIAADVFFRTLAQARQEKAIAIVLSGTGTDGTVGVRCVKEEGGFTMAQDPREAEHDGMPNAAIESGSIDFILPVAEMPGRLKQLQGSRHPTEITALLESLPGSLLEMPASSDLEAALQKIVGQLRLHTGHDFRHYKRPTMLRRIDRRLQVRGMPSLSAYAELLESDPHESETLLRDMLIGVTSFFRDREAFNALEKMILPDILANRRHNDPVRAWVAACSTGEEAYSLAMILCEQASSPGRSAPIQVFASDIDERAIAKARSAVYPSSIITDVAPERLQQHFSKEDDRYRVRKSIRDRVLFAPHNILRDPPFSRLDIVSCRNLLIYLNREMQMHLLEMFHFSLNPGGILFLGSSESADLTSHLFTPLDKKHRIYQAKALSRGRYPSSTGYPPLRQTAQEAPPLPAKRQFSFAEVHQRVLAQHAPPSIIVNRDAEIVFMSDRIGRFLRHVAGEPSRNLVSLVLPELRVELRTALFQATHSRMSVEARRVKLTRDGRTWFIHMTVRPFHDDEAGADLVLVLFDEVEQTMGDESGIHGEKADTVLAQLEEELQRTKEQLQETVEQSEISNEELRASNEELQAINEELRSATEELETSREELQSVNEELSTVNYELKSKVEETGKVNDDLNNLIASADIATIFVDRSMHIKRYTPRVAEIFNIIPSDVGRSLLDITHKLNYPELAADAAATFDTLRPLEREVRSSSGHTFIARVRPYRTVEDRIDGAVMTFFDISRHREAEEQLRRNAAQQAFMLRLSDTLRSLGDAPMIQREASRVLREHLGARLVVFWEAVSDDELALAGCSYAPGTPGLGSRLRLGDLDPGVGTAYRMGQIVCLEDAAREPSLTEAQRAAFAAEGTGGWIGVPLVKGGKPCALLGAAYPAPHKWSQAEIALVQEVAERTFAAMERAQAEAARQASEDALRESEARFRMLVEGFAQAVWETDAGGRLLGDSPSWRAYTGQSLEDCLAKGWLDTVHPDERGDAQRQWEDAVATGRLLNAQLRLRADDGGWRLTNVLATPLVDADGSVRKWIGVNIDMESPGGK